MAFWILTYRYAHPFVLSYREDRRWCGAGSPACGAVGGADWRKERCAGASAGQRDPWGTSPLVSPPFTLCRPDLKVQVACGKGHASDFPGLSQEMLSNVSCPGKGHSSPVISSLVASPLQPASSHGKPEGIYYLARNPIHTTVLKPTAWATWTWFPDLQKFSYFGSMETCFRCVLEQGRTRVSLFVPVPA